VPYASVAQQAFMHAKHPEIAKRWDKETKAEGKSFPKNRYVSKKGASRKKK